VRQTIRHARRMSTEGQHEWPTARIALTKILADLEPRFPGDPNLVRLRRYIALGDLAFRQKNAAERR
jgi:hypothetical protein